MARAGRARVRLPRPEAWLGPDCGWARRLTAGAALDPTPDLYDLAFVLFALAWRYKASGDRDALRRAHETVDFIEHRLRPDAGGLFPRVAAAAPRLQNPHMHLLEHRSPRSRRRRNHRSPRSGTPELSDLFRTRFFDGRTLAEFFTEELAAATRPEGRIVEPGHQFEWAWILASYHRVSGADVSPQAEALVAFSEAHGVDPGRR